MKQFKRVLSAVIAAVMIFLMFPILPVQVEATQTSTLAQLQAKYPHGKYWNHRVSKAEECGDLLDDYGNEDFGDSVTSTPCAIHPDYELDPSYYVGKYDCNYFDECWQCQGFARRLGYEAFGSKVSSWSMHYDIYSIKPGDVVLFTSADADATWGHGVFVIGVSGTIITVGEANIWNDPCGIRWGSQYDLSTAYSVTVWSAPYELNTDLPEIEYTSIAEGSYFLKHNSTGKYLSVDGGADADQQNISVSSYTGGTEMAVAITQKTNGYIMKPHCATRVVNPYGTSVSAGLNVSLWPDVDDVTQWWGFEKVTGGYIIRNMQNPYCVLAVNGTNVVTAAYTGESDQIWTLEKTTGYTVSYDANGGTNAPASQIKLQDVDLILSSQVPTREGYEFIGWSSAKLTSVGIYMPGGTYTKNEDATLHAVWAEKTYDLDANGTLTVYGSGPMTDYDVWGDGTYGSAPPPWYEQRDQIKKVVIEDGVTTIGNCAFYDCKNLTSVSIPDGVTALGSFSFAGCTSLDDVILPDSVTSLGTEGTFSNCTSLKTIKLGQGMGGQYTFSGCTSLESIVIPEGITLLALSSFDGCTNLKKVYLPSTIEYLQEDDLFYDCPSIEHVIYNGTKEQLLDIFYFNSSSKDYQEALLAKFRFEPSSGTCGDNAIWSISEDKVLTISGTGAMYDYTGADRPWEDNLLYINKIVIADGITHVGNYAFANFDKLTSVTFGANVRTIGEGAFYWDEALTEVTLPAGLQSIGAMAFRGNTGLTSITIPQGMTAIAERAFSECTGLSSVVIPVSVTAIAQEAFYGCSALQDVHYSGTQAKWNQISISSGNENLTGATIHTAPPEMTGLAIRTYPAKTQYYVGENLDTAGLVLAVAYDDGSVQQIAEGFTVSGFNSATAGQQTLTVAYKGFTTTFNVTVILGGTCGEELTWFISDTGTLTISGTGSIPDCENDTAPWLNYRDSISVVVLKEGITAVGDGAFRNCTTLETVTIPESLTNIGKNAFFGCSVLNLVDYGGTQQQWNEIVILDGNDNLISAQLQVASGCSVSTDGVTESYSSVTEAIKNSETGSQLTLLGNMEENITIAKSVALDLNGFTITGSITAQNDAVVELKDSQTDDYTVEDGQGYGKITGTVNGVVAQNGYLMITENGETSFHRLNLDAAGVTVRSSNAGIYYQNQFGGDEVIKRNIVAYGTALGAGKAPDFRDKTYTRFDDMSTWKVGMDQNGNSNNLENGTILKDIMRTGNAYSINSRNANMKIYSQGYVELLNGTIVKGDCVAFSLREMMEGTDSLKGVDQWFNSLKETKKEAILEFYETFKNNMQVWNIPNIKAAA